MTIAPLSSAEWLETDGLGGFAMGTASGVRSRRYHGLLVSALNPPTERVVLVSGFDAWEVLGLVDEIGSLRVGSCADLTLLRWNEQGEPLSDVSGNVRLGGRWETLATIRAGQVVGLADS